MSEQAKRFIVYGNRVEVYSNRVKVWNVIGILYGDTIVGADSCWGSQAEQVTAIIKEIAEKATSTNQWWGVWCCFGWCFEHGTKRSMKQDAEQFAARMRLRNPDVEYEVREVEEL